ncbi:VanZ family protein [[Clostridium] polysaccharolyticum]|uniref:VanZ family protein n=1 Tax=[Clostridium] polysaccharolyticum TaxID=29364 RepID=UPI0038CD754F
MTECINFKLKFNHLDTYQITGNILLTFPIGFCIPFLVNTTKRKNYIFTLLLSASIEFMQLVLIITLHTIDICFDLQDIILNILGSFLGCICFSLISKLIKKLSIRYFPETKSGNDIFSFIITICNNYSTHQKTFYGM